MSVEPNQIRVLLVRQNEDDVQVIRDMLAQAGNGYFKLDDVCGLSAGLERVSDGAVDLVLLDLSSSDKSGLDTLVQIDAHVPPVPVVVLTRCDDELLGLSAVQAGAQDYLCKSKLDSELLTRSIRRAIERQRILSKLEQNTRELEASAARFRVLVESNADGIAVIDRKGIVRFVNPALGALFGCDAEDLLCESFGFCLVTGETEEICVLSKDKGLRTTEMRVVETVWEGELVYLASLRDVTDRKQAEAQLKLRAQLLDAATDSIFLHDLEGNVEYFNEATHKTYGYTRDEFKLCNINKDVGAAESSRRKRKRLNDLIEKGTTFFESVHVLKDGSLLPVEVHSRVIEWEDRKLILSVSRDISERRRAQEEVKRGLTRLQRVLEGTVQAIASTVEMRDPYTAGHQRRVAQLACAIAFELGLTKKRIEGIRIAGLLHDIGKICVPTEILNKPGPVSQIEMSLFRTHSRFGYDILRTIEFPWPVADAVLQHHERLDGSGYPSGISSDAILLEARIIGVADVVEAMSSHRPYRPALGQDKALGEVTQNSGILYDRKVVGKCLELFEKAEFTFIKTGLGVP